MPAKPLASVSVVALLLATGFVARAEDKRTTEQGDLGASFLKTHCLECHSGDKPKGELRLDQLAADFESDAARKIWLDIQRRIQAGEMPPKEKPRPAAQEVTALADWIGSKAQGVEIARRAKDGRVVLRRLNRAEYENTICDLLGIRVNLKEQLPEDGSADGFDNAAAAHHTSAFLMEKYLEAADTALNMAIANRPLPPKSILKRYSMKDMHPVKSSEEDVYRFREGGKWSAFALRSGITSGSPNSIPTTPATIASESPRPVSRATSSR